MKIVKERNAIILMHYEELREESPERPTKEIKLELAKEYNLSYQTICSITSKLANYSNEVKQQLKAMRERNIRNDLALGKTIKDTAMRNGVSRSYIYTLIERLGIDFDKYKEKRAEVAAKTKNKHLKVGVFDFNPNKSVTSLLSDECDDEFWDDYEDEWSTGVEFNEEFLDGFQIY